MLCEAKVHYKLLIRLILAVFVRDNLGLKVRRGAKLLCVPGLGFGKGLALPFGLFLKGHVRSRKRLFFKSHAAVSIGQRFQEQRHGRPVKQDMMDVKVEVVSLRGIIELHPHKRLSFLQGHGNS